MAAIQHFQFPLSLLRIIPELHGNRHAATDRSALLRNTEPLGERIMTYSCMHLAATHWKKQVAAVMQQGYSDSEAADLFENHRYTLGKWYIEERIPFPCMSLHESLNLVFGQVGLGYIVDGTFNTAIPTSDFQREQKWYTDINTRVRQHDAWVRIHKDIVLELRAGKWTWDLFAVYCAVLSVIGTKKVPWIIRYQDMQARLEGYLTPGELPQGHQPLLSIDQIRTRIQKLETRSLIATYSERHTRNRLYWLPSQATNPEQVIARRTAKKKIATDKSAQRDRINALVQEMYQQEAGAEQSGALPSKQTPSKK
jgi:hypothetical protein